MSNIKYQNSKWTSTNKINGWRHYQVKNFFKKKHYVELFAVCDKKITVNININDLKDKNKWLEGWIKIIEK
tara:strand:+ start:222 stop:434 length:213 start_codon:yes stop_codon:yes gene_type:complete